MSAVTYTSRVQKDYVPEKHSQVTRYYVAPVDDPEQEELFLNNATSWIPAAPAYTLPRVSGLTLPKPVVIPRLDIGNVFTPKFPFVRVYAPDLRAFDIHEHDFVAFIDHLNVAQAPPAPLQALNVAGTAIGFVPHHWAMIAGIGLNVAAGAGTAASSAIRTRSYMDRVNREYFAPRGLKASVCKNEEVKQKTGYEGVLPEKAEGAGVTTLGHRQMEALESYIAPLSFEVPPPVAETNALDKMAAKSMEKRLVKVEKKARKKEEKRQQKEVERMMETKVEDDDEKRIKDEEKKEKKKEKKVVRDQKRIGKMEYIVIEMLDAAS